MMDFAHEYEVGFQPTIRWLQIKGLRLDQAEEVAQAAWARAWEHRDQLRGEAPRCWVLKIAWREWIRLLRSAYWRHRANVPKYLSVDNRWVRHADAQMDCAKVLNMLPRDLRQTVSDVYLRDIRPFEMGKDNGVARIRLHRAKLFVRERIAA